MNHFFVMNRIVVTLCSGFVSLLAFGQGGVAVPGTTATSAPAGAPGWINLVMLGGMFLLMWLFIIRPQAKRQKEHKNFLESLKVGQEVVTASGIIGKISQISDSVVTLNVGNTQIPFLKSGISAEYGKPASVQPEVIMGSSKT